MADTAMLSATATPPPTGEAARGRSRSRSRARSATPAAQAEASQAPAASRARSRSRSRSRERRRRAVASLAAAEPPFDPSPQCSWGSLECHVDTCIRNCSNKMEMFQEDKMLGKICADESDLPLEDPQYCCDILQLEIPTELEKIRKSFKNMRGSLNRMRMMMAELKKHSTFEDSTPSGVPIAVEIVD